jgi:anthranilate synthase component 1
VVFYFPSRFHLFSSNISKGGKHLIYPQFEQVLTLSRTFNVIPICQTFLADTETPIGLFQKLKRAEYAFLLESVEGGTRWARYSFVGSDPFLVFTAKDGRGSVRHRSGKREEITGNPMEELQRLAERYRAPQYDGFPPFLGGGVGSLGYESLAYVEKLPVPDADPVQSHDIHFMFYDKLCVFDHLKQQVVAVRLLHVPEPPPREEQLRRLYDETIAELNAWINTLRRQPEDHLTSPNVQDGKNVTPVPYRSNVTKAAYLSCVEKAKAYIRAGDIFQVVLSQRLEVEVTADPFNVYRVLRTLNPSPYMYVLQMGDETVVGTSPELLVKVTDGLVETRPIAGTRKRAASVEEDDRLAEELLKDEKERAEHLMLVDLGRNDVGRVAEYGTVKVEQFMEIERYSHVMHMVSHVTGKLKKGVSPFRALTSCLPAGTVSGAPKLRAMEIIAELEGERRGIYAGGIGYLAFSGNLDTCIAIRTIVFKNGKAYVQAGGGIVADSVPENEYEESINKARAMLTALAHAENMFQPMAQRS